MFRPPLLRLPSIILFLCFQLRITITGDTSYSSSNSTSYTVRDT
jgi:hypothetical protein